MNKAADPDDKLPSPQNGGVFVHHAEAVWDHREPYGQPGFRGLFTNYYASLCAAFAALGGMIFGYDQVWPFSATPSPGLPAGARFGGARCILESQLWIFIIWRVDYRSSLS